MFKKKCLFGGGLGLGSTIAIFASISSDVIAMEAVKAKNSIHDFRSELNQIVWSRACSKREFNIEYHNIEKYKWILGDFYKDSRTKVIGKAIGDCVAGEGAFANKTSEEIITFKDTDPKTYKQRNWNAVILYNYIHEAINGTAFKEFFTAGCDAKKNKKNKKNYVKQLSEVGGVLKNKLEKLKKHYEQCCGEKYTKRLDKAVEHIQKYVNTLSLIGYLYDFKVTKQKYDGIEEKPSNLAPDLDSGFDDNGGILSSPFYHADKDNYSIRILEYPSFECINGGLYIAVLGIEKQKKEVDSSYFGSIFSNPIKKYLPTWNEDPENRMWFNYKNIYELKKQDTWIAERLEGLAQIPTKEFLDEWVPLTDNGEENEQNN